MRQQTKSAIFCLDCKNKTVFEDEGVTFSICTKLYVLVTRETDYLRYWGGLCDFRKNYWSCFCEYSHPNSIVDPNVMTHISALSGRNESGKKI